MRRWQREHLDKHKPFDVQLKERGWTGVCGCGEPVRYVSTIRDGEWKHGARRP